MATTATMTSPVTVSVGVVKVSVVTPDPCPAEVAPRKAMPGAVTLSVAVELMLEAGSMAVMVVEPIVRPVATPSVPDALLIVATASDDDDQVTASVMS